MRSAAGLIFLVEDRANLGGMRGHNKVPGLTRKYFTRLDLSLVSCKRCFTCVGSIFPANVGLS